MMIKVTTFWKLRLHTLEPECAPCTLVIYNWLWPLLSHTSEHIFPISEQCELQISRRDEVEEPTRSQVTIHTIVNLLCFSVLCQLHYLIACHTRACTVHVGGPVTYINIRQTGGRQGWQCHPNVTCFMHMFFWTNSSITCTALLILLPPTHLMDWHGQEVFYQA